MHTRRGARRSGTVSDLTRAPRTSQPRPSLLWLWRRASSCCPVVW